MIIPKSALFLIFLFFLQANFKRPSQEDYCLNSCTNSENGRCSSHFKRCLCNRGFFGEDCRQQALSLSYETTRTVSIGPGICEYFYLDLDCISLPLSFSSYLSQDTMEDLQFEFETSHQTVEYSFVLQDPEESILPDQTDSRTLKVSSSGEPSQTVTINKLELEEFEGGLLLIGIQNLDSEETVTLKIKTHFGKLILMILLTK